jgi:hypothetical protein
MTRDGQPALVSQKKNSVVMIRPALRHFSNGGRPVFVVAIHNVAKEPLEFRVHDIAVTQVAGSTAVPLKVFSYEDLAEEEQTKQVIAALLGGAAAGADVALASRAGYRTHTTTVNGPGGSHTFQTTSYNPTTAVAAQNRALRRDSRLIKTAIRQSDANLAALERDVLKDDTLMPGEWYGGTITLEPLADAADSTGPKHYAIAMTVGPDHHEIDVVQSHVN